MSFLFSEINALECDCWVIQILLYLYTNIKHFIVRYKLCLGNRLFVKSFLFFIKNGLLKKKKKKDGLLDIGPEHALTSLYGLSIMNGLSNIFCWYL